MEQDGEHGQRYQERGGSESPLHGEQADESDVLDNERHYHVAVNARPKRCRALVLRLVHIDHLVAVNDEAKSEEDA